MTNLAEHIIVAEAENRPPMLEKSMYNSWASHIRLFIKGKKHGRMMLDSIDNDDCDVQATNIILHGNPPDVMTMQQVQVNTKFLNALPLEWSKFVTDVKLAKSLYTTNYDQLYAYLSKHKKHANEVPITRERYPDHLALVSNSPNSIQSISVTTTFMTQQSQVEFPKLDSSLAISMFKQGEDPIECINKAVAFLSVVASRVTIPQVQGRQTQSYASTRNRGIATTSKGNYAAGQPRVVKCYNYQGEGHMARQCTQTKRPRNVTWFKEKLMLAEAQEAGQILDEEQLAFLADPGISEPLDAQQIIHHNSAFQTEDLNAYDSNCDDLSLAKVVLMANLSSYDPEVLSEVPYSDSYPNDMINQDVQEMQYSEQTHVDYFEDNEIHSCSNIILYSQYLQESQDVLIQDTNPSAPNDLLVPSLVEQMTDHVAHLDKENQTNKMELLVYVSKRCPDLPKPSEKLVAVTPLNKNKRVRFAKPIISSSNIPKQTDSLKTKDSNKPLLTSTGVKPTTSASESKPSGNTKNNRITRPSSNQKNKVEDHSRKVKSSLNKINSISEPNSNALVKRNAKFESICVILWKPTGKVFSEIGYSWKPTSRNFTIIRNRCPLTRITSNKIVPPKETTIAPVVTPTSRILVYNKRPKATRSVSSSSKVKIVKSKTSNSKEPKQSWRSTVSDVPSFLLMITGTVRFGNDHIAKIMGYGDYQMGNVTISWVYYVESSRPGPKLLTPGTIISGLIPNIPSSTLYVPPTKNDWEILLQPMFDEYLNPPSCVDPQVPAVITPKPVVSTGTSSSKIIDQDAPSTSTSQTPPETPSLVIPLGVKEADHDIEVAYMDNNPSV
ncbi:hypothetical protein Tco_1360549 [Tanacetum coccineum]